MSAYVMPAATKDVVEQWVDAEDEVRQHRPRSPSHDYWTHRAREFFLEWSDPDKIAFNIPT